MFASGALSAVGDLARLIGIVILMLVLDWKLSLFAFAAVPPMAVLVVLVRRNIREAFRAIRAKTSRMNATMNEQVTGMTLIQAFGRQEAAAAEFDESNLSYRDANMRAIKWDSIQDAAIDTIAAICLALVIASFGYRAGELRHTSGVHRLPVAVLRTHLATRSALHAAAGGHGGCRAGIQLAGCGRARRAGARRQARGRSRVRPTVRGRQLQLQARHTDPVGSELCGSAR
ncbi:MAG: ABC transporter transmembrane domain-containing protein [Pseudomonadota bacterium]